MSMIFNVGTQRALRKPKGLKPPDCDCWVGGDCRNFRRVDRI